VPKKMTQKKTKVGLRKIPIKISCVNRVWLEPSTSRTMTFGPVRRLRFIFLVLFMLGDDTCWLATRVKGTGFLFGTGREFDPHRPYQNPLATNHLPKNIVLITTIVMVGFEQAPRAANRRPRERRSAAWS
jgi:hypothetical protein